MCHRLAAGIGIADQKHVCSMLESRGHAWAAVPPRGVWFRTVLHVVALEDYCTEYDKHQRREIADNRRRGALEVPDDSKAASQSKSLSKFKMAVRTDRNLIPSRLAEVGTEALLLFGTSGLDIVSSRIRTLLYRVRHIPETRNRSQPQARSLRGGRPIAGLHPKAIGSTKVEDGGTNRRESHPKPCSRGS